MQGDGQVCVRQPRPVIDYCSSNPCFRDVDCTNRFDGFVCGNCPSGFEGNGEECKKEKKAEPELDPCEPNPCFNGVKCVAVWEGMEAKFSCGLCPDGNLWSLFVANSFYDVKFLTQA